MQSTLKLEGVFAPEELSKLQKVVETLVDTSKILPIIANMNQRIVKISAPQLHVWQYTICDREYEDFTGRILNEGEKSYNLSEIQSV